MTEVDHRFISKVVDVKLENKVKTFTSKSP